MPTDDRVYILEVYGYRVGPVTGLLSARQVKRRFDRTGLRGRLVPLESVKAGFQKVQAVREAEIRENIEMRRNGL